MANFISNIRDFFSRPTRSELVALSRALSSKQGIKLSAMLQQQTDSLTKKDVADWRAAHQMAIDYENPGRARLYDIYVFIADSDRSDNDMADLRYLKTQEPVGK